MKLFSMLAFLAASSAFASSPTSFDVQLDNPAYAPTVKAAFEARRVPFRFVAEAAPGTPKITIRASHASGCKLKVTADTASSSLSRTREQSMPFRGEAGRFAKCKELLNEMIDDTLSLF